MRRVARPTSRSDDTIYATLLALCDATEQQTETIADAYVVTTPTGFMPSRSLDLSGTVTAAQVGAVLATLLMDLKKRGSNRKQANV